MFWEGFFKQAGVRVGVTALRPLSQAGKRVGNTPSTLVSTKAAVKPAPLPTSKPSSAKDISQPKLPDSANIR